MKTEAKESIKKILVICFASFLMALNIKSFVRTGGLYPGGATGLALLIQRAADMFLHITIPYTIVNILLNAIPVFDSLVKNSQCIPVWWSCWQVSWPISYRAMRSHTIRCWSVFLADWSMDLSSDSACIWMQQQEERILLQSIFQKKKRSIRGMWY